MNPISLILAAIQGENFNTEILTTGNESQFGENIINLNMHILSLTCQLDQMKMLFGNETYWSGIKVITWKLST